MSEKADKYVIAVKREKRSDAPADWVDQLKEISEVSIVGKPTTSRILAEASPQAIEKVKNLIGDFCHIEPLIIRKPLMFSEKE